MPPDSRERAPVAVWVQALGRVDRALAAFEKAALVLCLLALVVVAVFDALKRNFFPPNVYWSRELIRFSTFFIGMLGAALAAQSGQLISIDLLTRLFSPRGRLILRVATTCFTLCVCAVFFLGSLKLYAGTSLAGEIIPERFGTLAMPVAAVLIAVHMIVRLLGDLDHLFHKRVPADLLHVAPSE